MSSVASTTTTRNGRLPAGCNRTGGERGAQRRVQDLVEALESDGATAGRYELGSAGEAQPCTDCEYAGHNEKANPPKRCWSYRHTDDHRSPDGEGGRHGDAGGRRWNLLRSDDSVRQGLGINEGQRRSEPPRHMKTCESEQSAARQAIRHR